MEPRIDPTGFKRVLRERRAGYEPVFASGVWRLRELLPRLPSSAIVSLGEGNVPLYESTHGARFAGLAHLSYLHLGMNPTGSFKDLGMTVAVSAAKADGVRGVVCAGAGSTASSMAAYAARANLEAYAIVADGAASRANLAQTLEYGACVVETGDSFDDAFRALQRKTERLTVVNATNAHRSQGQKCAAYALLEARAWSVPDWVVLSSRHPGNNAAIDRGFQEARELGLIDRSPRFAVIDAALDETSIAQAKASIGRDGISCEPSSAAALAGARELRASGAIEADADVVVVLT